MARIDVRMSNYEWDFPFPPKGHSLAFEEASPLNESPGWMDFNQLARASRITRRRAGKPRRPPAGH
jgi:hypothetical protein